MMNNTSSYHSNLVLNVTGGINQRWAKLQKEMCVNSLFVSVFVSLLRVRSQLRQILPTGSQQVPNRFGTDSEQTPNRLSVFLRRNSKNI
jgi:hypothetical protein